MKTNVSSAEAQLLFTLVASQSQIPFTYPDDGCWARAHEMCRILIANEVQPDKVWIYGNLHTPTKNSPNCAVDWRYHVAPVLNVEAAAGTIDKMVIDPSLFKSPVDEATWNHAMQDPGATLAETDASVFFRPLADAVSYDPNYVETQNYLRQFRNLLLSRIAEDGPPPYNCPGVQ